MEFNTTRGLRFANKSEYSGKLFLTDFEEEKAQEVISKIKSIYQKLLLYYMMNGSFADDAEAAQQTLQAIADDNPELFLYGLKAVMFRDSYFLSPNDRSKPERVYRECLGEILSNAINTNPEKWLPIFRHMLQVWPHTKSWSVISDILCRAYAGIEASDADCIHIIAHGLLCDPYSWKAAFDAMMTRAEHVPGEAIAQFNEVFSFFDLYGETATGKDGISIPQNIYSSKDSTMRQAFEAQSEEVKQELRDIGAITLGTNKQVRHYLSRMFGINEKGEDFGDIEALFISDSAAAKEKIEQLNVRTIIGWDNLKSPDLVRWLGEKTKKSGYSITEKQILGYRLSMFKARNQNKAEKADACQAARDVLCEYSPADNSDLERVLAGCFKMLSAASDSNHNTFPGTIQQNMAELLVSHSNMEVNQRSKLDMSNMGGIWRNMISNYSLSAAIQSALASIIRSTDLNKTDAVRKVFKIIADTFSPLDLNNPRVLKDAIPHREIRDMLNGFLAFDPKTKRFNSDFEFLRMTLPKILDALESISIQEIYDRYYREIVGHFHIYCSMLNDNDLHKIRDSYSRILGLIRKFPQIVGE